MSFMRLAKIMISAISPYGSYVENAHQRIRDDFDTIKDISVCLFPQYLICATCKMIMKPSNPQTLD